MKIVILDGYTINPGDLSWDGLREMGEVILYDRTEKTAPVIIDRIGVGEISLYLYIVLIC